MKRRTLKSLLIQMRAGLEGAKTLPMSVDFDYLDRSVTFLIPFSSICERTSSDIFLRSVEPVGGSPVAAFRNHGLKIVCSLQKQCIEKGGRCARSYFLPICRLEIR